MTNNITPEILRKKFWEDDMAQGGIFISSINALNLLLKQMT